MGSRTDDRNQNDSTVVNLSDELTRVDGHWHPRIVARYNGNKICVVKLLGEFVWHSHDDTDDLFHVISGRLTIEQRDANGHRRDVHLGPGELYVVPRGVEHRPVAVEEVELLLIEPDGTPNTGDAATAVTPTER